MFAVIQVAMAPQAGTEGLKLRTVIGYNGNGRGNMVWSPDQGCQNTLNVQKKNIFRFKIYICGYVFHAVLYSVEYSL